MIAYAQGRQDRSAPGSTVLSQAPAAFTASPSSAANRGGRVAKARIALDNDRGQPVPTSSLSSPSTTNPNAPNPTTQPELKRKEEVALTVAAITAILVQASRDQYHATGRPCACLDDLMRNGRAYGGRSAYSRPGGAGYKGDKKIASRSKTWTPRRCRGCRCGTWSQPAFMMNLPDIRRPVS